MCIRDSYYIGNCTQSWAVKAEHSTTVVTVRNQLLFNYGPLIVLYGFINSDMFLDTAGLKLT